MGNSVGRISPPYFWWWPLGRLHRLNPEPHQKIIPISVIAQTSFQEPVRDKTALLRLGRIWPDSPILFVKPRNRSWITKVHASSWRTSQNNKMSHHQYGEHEFFYFTMPPIPSGSFLRPTAVSRLNSHYYRPQTIDQSDSNLHNLVTIANSDRLLEKISSSQQPYRVSTMAFRFHHGL